MADHVDVGEPDKVLEIVAQLGDEAVNNLIKRIKRVDRVDLAAHTS